MAYLKSKKVLTAMFLLFVAVIFSACNNSDRPVGPGTSSNFVLQDCNGVFGNNIAEPTSTTANDLWFNPFSPNSNTTLVSLSVYTASSSSVPVTYEAGVYSDNFGSPGNLFVRDGAGSGQWAYDHLEHGVVSP